VAQVTLYLDEETIKRMRREARASGVSQSRWLADLVRERTATQWPEAVRELAGAWDDFPETDELRRSVGRDGSASGLAHVRARHQQRLVLPEGKGESPALLAQPPRTSAFLRGALRLEYGALRSQAGTAPGSTSPAPMRSLGDSRRAAARIRQARARQADRPDGRAGCRDRLEQQAILVTHNTKELRRVKGLRLEDWY
jgi:hypothetical protein